MKLCVHVITIFLQASHQILGCTPHFLFPLSGQDMQSCWSDMKFLFSIKSLQKIDKKYVKRCSRMILQVLWFIICAHPRRVPKPNTVAYLYIEH